MSPVLPTAGQRPYDLNTWLLVGHDVNGNNLGAGPDATKVDKDSVVVAATRLVASKLLAGDAQPAYWITGDGTHRWGPGGATAIDSTLYRSAASTLTAIASLIVTGNHNVSYSLGVDKADGGGGLYFGSASDVILTRAAAQQLQLSGHFKATGNVFGTQYVAAFGTFGDAQAQMLFHANYTGTGGAVRWGPGGSAALDCDLYRAGPGSLVTGGGLIVGGGLTANSLITGNYSTAFQAGSNASGAVALNAANLPNNGYLFSMKQLADASWRLLVTSAGQLIWGDGAGNPTANLYWKSASTLGTDSNFYAGGEMRANNGGVSTQIYLGGDGKIYFGTAGDTDIYRAGAGALKTDGQLYVGQAFVGGNTVYSQPSVNAPGFIYNPSAATNNALVSQLQGEANARLTIDVSGYHSWGPGGATALDTNLYRVAAGALRTDSLFIVGGTLYVGTSVVVDNASAGNRLYFGNALDASIYRSAAGQLKTDGTFQGGTVIAAKTTSYTLVLADANTAVEMNIATGNTLTVPPNSSVAFPIGTTITITQYGAGLTTLTPGAGVTIRSYNGNLKLAGQFALCTLVKRGTDEWYAAGNLVP